jgi:D-amino-acid dehydrogenase
MSDVVIVGGGVIGLCSAYYATLKGHRVTVIDRDPEEMGGASSGNAGMIVPSHFVPMAAPGIVAMALKWMLNPESPFYIKPRMEWALVDWGLKFWAAATREKVRAAAPLLRDLHLASRECFVELSTASKNEFGLATEGLLMLCKSAHALEEEETVANEAERLGIPARVLNADQTAKLDPNVQMEIAGAVYFPKDCHLSPARFLGWLRSELRRLGVRFLWENEVRGWNFKGDRILSARTTSEEIRGEEFLLTTGAWSSNQARALSLVLPMQAGKGYSLTLENPREMPRICSILTEARVAVTPMGTSLRFGGTMEMAGLHLEINERRVRGIINAVPEYFPNFRPDDFAPIKPWCGLRPCSPDGLPYVGRAARWKNLTIATGHGMMGLSLGPITGKLVGSILSGEDPAISIAPLSPDRFG